MLDQLKRSHIVAIAVSFLTLLVALAIGTSGHEILSGCGDFCRRLGCGGQAEATRESQFKSQLEWAEKLTDFIRSERQCCPFFVFELKFEPEQGPIRMSIRGGDGVKEFLEGFES